MDDPYDILGLDPSASLQDVRARYLELAKKLHPDKIGPDATDDERSFREEEFKKCSAAYQYIMGKKRQDVDDETGTGFASENKTSDGPTNFNWKNYWSRFLGGMPDIKDTLSNVANEMLKHVSARKTFHSPISVEEFFWNKPRSFRLWPKDAVRPMIVTIKPHEFLYSKNLELEVIPGISVKAHPKESLGYKLSNNGWDLETEVELSLLEYFSGTEKVLKWFDGSEFTVKIGAYVSMDTPIVITKRGIGQHGRLLLKWKISLPTNASNAKTELETISGVVFGQI